MATATDPTITEPTTIDPHPPATGVHPTVADALAAGARVAARLGGGVPVVLPLADGTALLKGVVLEPGPIYTGTAALTTPHPILSTVAQLDEEGRIIPDPPEDQAARARAAEEWLARRETHAWDEDQVHRSEQAMKLMGVPGYEDVVLDEAGPSAGGG